jgi:hypothetical protein
MNTFADADLELIQQHARDFGLRVGAGGLVIPRNAIPFQVVGSQPTPLLGAGQVELCVYRVQPQWFAVVTGLVFQYVGTPLLVPGAGDGIWSVDINRPVAALAALGYAEKDYGSVTVPLGSLQIPWPCDFRHHDDETIRIKFEALANIAPGAPNFAIGLLQGYTWPGQGWED